MQRLSEGLDVGYPNRLIVRTIVASVIPARPVSTTLLAARFGGAYLQRRLARQTNGEVTFDALPSRDDLADDKAPRMTTLTCMRTLINAWNLRHGIAFDAPSSALARGSRGNRTLENRYQNDEARRVGTSSFVSANVVPFDV